MVYIPSSIHGEEDVRLLLMTWVARLRLTLQKAFDAEDIDYVFSEKIFNTDYVRVLRE